MHVYLGRSSRFNTQERLGTHTNAYHAYPQGTRTSSSLDKESLPLISISRQLSPLDLTKARKRTVKMPRAAAAPKAVKKTTGAASKAKPRATTKKVTKKAEEDSEDVSRDLCGSWDISRTRLTRFVWRLTGR